MGLTYAERKQKSMDDIAKLPKWAQELFADLQRERDSAVNELRRFEASQTPTRIWTEGHICTGESSSPSEIKRYLDPDVYWVHFKVGKEQHQEVEVGFSYRDERFQIRSLTTPLMLVMDCANTVEVRVP